MSLKKILAIMLAVVFAMTMTVISATAANGDDNDNDVCDYCVAGIECGDCDACNADPAEDCPYADDCDCPCCDESSPFPWTIVVLSVVGAIVGVTAIGNLIFWGTTIVFGASAIAGWVANNVIGLIFG